MIGGRVAGVVAHETRIVDDDPPRSYEGCFSTE